eukprot:8169028-Karenia_brevis.AAC.1
MSPFPGEEDFVLLFIDITRAHPHCVMKRNVWATLPPAGPNPSNPKLCAKLLPSVYGLRDAGQSFELFTYE